MKNKILMIIVLITSLSYGQITTPFDTKKEKNNNASNAWMKTTEETPIANCKAVFLSFSRLILAAVMLSMLGGIEPIYAVRIPSIKLEKII